MKCVECGAKYLYNHSGGPAGPLSHDRCPFCGTVPEVSEE